MKSTCGFCGASFEGIGDGRLPAHECISREEALRIPERLHGSLDAYEDWREYDRISEELRPTAEEIEDGWMREESSLGHL